MLQKTTGIVLRSVKYGESSLITTIFTAQFGVQSYMIRGIRNPKSKQNRTGMLQPVMLLDLVVYNHPHKNLQRIGEFQPAWFYKTLQEDIIKNSIALFSIELLLRLLPEQAPMITLFDFAFNYFTALDKSETNAIGNFPLFFIINCSRILGYELHGSYREQTPFLDLAEGGFSSNTPASIYTVTNDDAIALDNLIRIKSIDDVRNIAMNGSTRMRLIDWYITFLQRHTHHMGNIKSLSVLQAILH